MARYSLVMVPKKGVEGEPFFVPFGKNSKGDPRIKADLEEIDFFTNSYASFADLETYIKNTYGVGIETSFFEIQYVYKGKVCKLTPVVNNTFLKECASYSLKEKKRTGQGVLTEEVSSFALFKKRIFCYMDDDKTFPLLLEDPLKLVPSFLKKDLYTYRHFRKAPYLTPGAATDFRDLKDSFSKMLSLYKNMRGMFLWEQLYLSSKLPTYQKPVFDKTSSSMPPFEEKEEEDDDEYAFLSEEEKREMAGYDIEATYRRFR